jgi:predicted esterase
MRPQPDFIREFVPGASNQTLLLLHGTGGNERDLISLGGELDLSSVRVSIAGGLYGFVALLWLIPDPRIEREIEKRVNRCLDRTMLRGYRLGWLAFELKQSADQMNKPV